MVRAFARFIHTEIRGVHEAAYLLGGFALLSQILALLRDRLLAHYFGAGASLDVYYAAFRIPDTMFVTVASIVSVYALIPFLAAKKDTSSELKEFLSVVWTGFSILMMGVSVLAFFLAPFLVRLLFPGLIAAGLGEEVVTLTRIMLLQPFLLGTSNLFGSVTQLFERFILFAISPLLYNFGIILGILLLYPLFGLPGLAWGVVLGACLHLLIQVPFLVSQGLLPRFQTLRFNILRAVMALSLPRTLALSMQHLLLLAMTGIASVLASGSIAVFTLASNLQAVPLAIVGVSYSVATFPTLARLFTQGERVLFVDSVLTAARHILFWSLPIMVLAIVLRAHIVRVILGSGAFSWTDTRLTAAALALFMFSLAAQGFVLLLMRGYYAAGNTRVPVIAAALGALTGITVTGILVHLFLEGGSFKLFFEELLRVGGLSGTAVLMLPIGYSAGALVQAGFLLYRFEKDFGQHLSALLASASESAFAALIAGVCAYGALQLSSDLFHLTTTLGVFLHGALGGVVGVGGAVVVLLLMQSQEFLEVKDAVHQKLWPKPSVVPEE